MLTKQQSHDFMSFLEGYLSFYQEFLEIETNKHEVISQNDVKQLDRFVTKEQAYLLKSKGLEAQRQKMMDSYGFKDTTLNEFLPHLDSSVQEKADTLYHDLSDVLMDFKAMNTRCNSLIELRLHRIGNSIKHLENEGMLPKSYTNTAKTCAKPMSMISKKI